jgi:16S rRNA processing protein RimM
LTGSSESRLLEIGRVVKMHGLGGEVVVELVTDRVERLAPGTTLDVAGTAYVVASSRPHQRRWLVRFEGLSNREAADALRGAVLRAPPLPDDDALWVHDLIGAIVVTPDGRERGRVVAVEANPAHDLLVLESGALVPAVFVTGWAGEARLEVNPPSGLFDDDPG